MKRRAGNRHIGSDVMVYGLGTVLGQVVTVVTVPVYARHLGAEDFGRLEIIAALVSLVVSAVSDAAGSGVMREFYGEEERGARELVGTGLLLTLGAAVALSVVAASAVVALDLLEGSEVSALTVAAVSVPIAAVSRVLTNVSRIRRRAGGFFVASVSRAFVAAGAGIFALVVLDLGVMAFYIGAVAGALASGLISALLERSQVSLRYSRTAANAIASYAWPLIPVALAGWSLMLVDRFLLSAFVSLDEIGIYGVASRFAGLLLLAAFAFQSAYTPYILERSQRDDATVQQIQQQALALVMVAAAACAAVLAAMAPEFLTLVVGESYRDGAATMPALVLGGVAFATVPVTQTTMLIERRTDAMAWLTGVSAVTNIVVGLALMPAFGIRGAAAATAVGFVTQAVGYYVWSQRIRPVAFSIGGDVLLIVALLATTGFAWLPEPPLWVTASKAAVLVPLLLLAALQVRARLARLRHLDLPVT